MEIIADKFNFYNTSILDGIILKNETFHFDSHSVRRFSSKKGPNGIREAHPRRKGRMKGHRWRCQAARMRAT
jgi:hypothetical protein